MRTLKKSLSFLSLVAILTGACKKDEPALPDNLLQFEASDMGFAANDDEATVKLVLSRATDKDIAVSIALTDSAVTYGNEYTTVPASTGGKIAIIVPAGSSEATFTIKKKDSVLLDGDEKVTFAIESVTTPVLKGKKEKLSVQFSEIISASASTVIDGGGAAYPNKVFIDLSANRYTGVARSTWDLGLYTGDVYRVILNSSSAMMAKQISKTDLNIVTAADTAGFGAQVIFNQFAPTTESLAYIDYPDGDLNKTAIAEIAANVDDNKVYIINRGKGAGSPAPDRGWKKVKIIRNASGGYTVQYADIAATSFQQVDITKDDQYFFKYVSFDNGAVDVEPKKTKWDIAWTYFSNVTSFGGGEVPYTFQDMILQNRNAQTAKVMEADKAYSTFSAADLTGITFSDNQVNIGSDWRSGGGPTSAPSVRMDRYYIIKDGDGNYYKLKFTALTKDGVRGYPAIEYALVKAK